MSSTAARLRAASLVASPAINSTCRPPPVRLPRCNRFPPTRRTGRCVAKTCRFDDAFGTVSPPTWTLDRVRRPEIAGNGNRGPSAGQPLASAGLSTRVGNRGAGFLAFHLSEHLLNEGHRVICIDNLETGSLQNIEHIRDDSFEFRHIDITEYVDIPEKVDFVYHLASPASPIDYLRLPLHTLKVGSHGTHHMLGVAKFKRARFLIASTSEVYGDPQVHPQQEDYWGHVNPIGPRGVYDEAKRHAEAPTTAYHRPP